MSHSSIPAVPRLSIAPMMDWTDRHCRYFHRLLAPHALLYTEMVTTGALLHGDVERHLGFDGAEHPVALQLGGSDPQALAQCAALGEQYGYDEINLNCGCPSDRVQGGGFGACLMREPALVADCVRAMRGATALPVTVKHRIGIDDCEDYAFMRRFVDAQLEAGCTHFVVHARKAWLQGLSPKENREVPPLTYEHVYRLKQESPQLTIVINGGIRTADECRTHLQHVDGVMLGREAYENPYLLASLDRELNGDTSDIPTRDDVLRAFIPYAAAQIAQGTPLARMTRHILGLYRGQPGGRAFRRWISEQAPRAGAGVEVLEQALLQMQAGPRNIAA